MNSDKNNRTLVEKRTEQLRIAKVITDLSKKDTSNLVRIKSLNDKEKELLEYWRHTQNVIWLSKKMKCSRPYIYKIMMVLSKDNIMELDK